MSKLMTVLLAGVVASAGAIAQTSTTTPTTGATSGSASGSVSGSTSSNTNNNSAISANVNTNTNTNANTNNVSVYGPGSNKLAKQQQPAGTTGVSMMPGKGKQAPATTDATKDSTKTASSDHGTSRKWCPPGLAKKDNGCMPPGQHKKIGKSSDSEKTSDAAKTSGDTHTHHRKG